MNEIKAAENRRIRGEILNILHFNYPIPLSDRQIIRYLEELNMTTYSDINAHLEYLSDSEYITKDVKALKSIRQENTFVKLLPKGINLIEHNIPDDAGIDFL